MCARYKVNPNCSPKQKTLSNSFPQGLRLSLLLSPEFGVGGGKAVPTLSLLVLFVMHLPLLRRAG